MKKIWNELNKKEKIQYGVLLLFGITIGLILLTPTLSFIFKKDPPLTLPDIEIVDDDVEEEPIDDEIDDNIQDDIETRLLVEYETIRFEKEYTESATLNEGEIEIYQTGKEGRLAIEYELTYINGVLEEKKEINRYIVEEPIEERAWIGTKKDEPEDPDEEEPEDDNET